MVGIIGAMDSEVAGLKEMLESAAIEKYAGAEFYKGTLHGRDVVVVKCGYGKVNAGICTQILVDRFEVDYIINTGIAGCLDRELDILDMIISTDVMEHDMDCTPLGFCRCVIPGIDKANFCADKMLIEKAKDAAANLDLGIKVKTGRILSGDVFIADKEKSRELKDELQGSCVEMEGAAVGHAAYLNNVPFVVIRTMSDKADDSANEDVLDFEQRAAGNSIAVIAEMVKNM